MTATVLIVDDQPQMRRLLTVSLRRRGYQTKEAGSAEEAISVLAGGPVDVVLLDLNLIDLDGLDVCREIRQWSQVPIIVVSVRSRDREKVEALDAGADDFVTKPFSMDELNARMRACLRRSEPRAHQAVLSVGPISVDLARREVTRNSIPVHLTPTEYTLLRVLAANAGRVITHQALLRELRGPAYEGDTPILRVHMVGLRRKLDVAPHHPGHVATEPGVGYRMIDAEG